MGPCGVLMFLKGKPLFSAFQHNAAALMLPPSSPHPFLPAVTQMPSRSLPRATALNLPPPHPADPVADRNMVPTLSQP